MPEETTASFTSNASIESLIYVIAMLLLIFVAAYLVTRFVGGRARMGAGQGRIRHMQVVETLSLGRDRNVVMVEVGGYYCLLGVSNQNITLLGSYDPETLSPITLEEGAVLGTARGMADRIVQWNQDRKSRRTDASREARQPSPRTSGQERRANTMEEEEIDEILQSLRERRARYGQNQEEDRRL